LCLAGLELAKRCYSSNKESTLGDFLERLIPQLEQERDAVKQVLHSLSASDSLLKNVAAWGAEKLGRFKLNDTLLSYSPLSRVVELETLLAGIDAQILMWEVLECCVADEAAFPADIDCARYVNEEKALRRKLKAFHTEAAKTAFRSKDASTSQ
jgi:hypothetical protein